MKKSQVIWTAEAIHDLEIIYDFLAANSPTAAQRICENLLNRAQQIETFPESGAPHVGLQKADKVHRYLVEGNYKIIYSFQSKLGVVYIHTIFDSRLNPEKLKI